MKSQQSEPKAEYKEIEDAFSSLTKREKKVFGLMFCDKSRQLKTLGDLETYANETQGDSEAVKKILSFNCFSSVLTPIAKYIYLNVDKADKLVTLINSGAVQVSVKDQIANLVKQANEGNLVALHELASWAIEATKQLELMADTHPAYMALVAKEKSTWPILAVPNKAKVINKIAILEQICLGSDAPDVTTYTRALMNPTPPQEWAVRLVKTIDTARRLKNAFYTPSKSKKKNRGHTFSTAPAADQFATITIPENLLLKKKELHVFAKNLEPMPDFSSSTVGQWWKTARQLFLDVTNNTPWTVQELSTYANSVRLDKNAIEKKQDGVMRDNVVKAVRQAFFDLASS